MSYYGPMNRPPPKVSDIVREISDDEKEEIQKRYDEYMDKKHKEHCDSLFKSYLKRMF